VKSRSSLNSRMMILSVLLLFCAPAGAASRSFVAQCTGQSKINTGTIEYPAVDELKSFPLGSKIFLEFVDITSWSGDDGSGTSVDYTYYSAKHCWGLAARKRFSMTLNGNVYSTDSFGPSSMAPFYIDSSGQSDSVRGGFVYCVNDPTTTTDYSDDGLPTGAKKFRVEKWALKKDFDRQSRDRLFMGMIFTVHLNNEFGNGITVWFRFVNARELAPLYYISDTPELIGMFGNPPFQVFDDTHVGDVECKIRLK
jgi:hypothetical protein